MVLLVGWREDLALIDVVHAQGLQDLCLHEVANPALGHDRDRYGLHDLDDLVRVGHTGDTTLSPDVCGDPLQSHDGASSRILGDLRLLGVGHVHYHTALKHLCQAALHCVCADLLLHLPNLLTHVSFQDSRRHKQKPHSWGRAVRGIIVSTRANRARGGRR